jgi:hypothetical protein
MDFRWEARLPLPAEDARELWVALYERGHSPHGPRDGHRAVVRSGNVTISEDVLGNGRLHARTVLRPAGDDALTFETSGRSFRAAGRLTFHVATTHCRVAVEGRVEPLGIARFQRSLEARIGHAIVEDLQRHADELPEAWRRARGLPPA